MNAMAKNRQLDKLLHSTHRWNNIPNINLFTGVKFINNVSSLLKSKTNIFRGVRIWPRENSVTVARKHTHACIHNTQVKQIYSDWCNNEMFPVDRGWSITGSARRQQRCRRWPSGQRRWLLRERQRRRLARRLASAVTGSAPCLVVKLLRLWKCKGL